MCWARVDEKRRIWEASKEERDGWTVADDDMTGWTLLDESVPMYKLTENGKVARRTDQEIKRDKKGTKN